MGTVCPAVLLLSLMAIGQGFYPGGRDPPQLNVGHTRPQVRPRQPRNEGQTELVLQAGGLRSVGAGVAGDRASMGPAQGRGSRGAGDSAAGPVRASRVSPDSSPRAAVPQATLLPRCLSIQEERGAPGRAGGNYNSQAALRRRGGRRGPMRARGLRALGPASQRSLGRAL